MSLDHRLSDILAAQKELSAMQEQLLAGFGNGAGAGGSGGGMENRVSRLEGQFDKLRDDNALLRDRIGATREELAKLTERVGHLPSKDDLWKTALAIVVALTAVITFADKLQSLVK